MTVRTCSWIITTLSLLYMGSGLSAADSALDYSRDVRPILSDKCYKCHGPDKGARQADLRLDQRSTAGEVLDSSNGMSELLRRITSDDPNIKMPPPGSKLSLNDHEVETLRRWVSEGAGYSVHWSFQPIRKPDLPDLTGHSWPSNEIDLFVLAKLEEFGWSPAMPANRERLIRRLCFDLTGLPPTLEQIDQFLDDTTDKAYQRLVNRLLESERYGERMAANWLDVARYADSYGYQVDRDRFVWPWRDWVVQAFNDNMPYDHFLSLQLAGDLFPQANDQQILATTFNRLHSQKVEGGSVPEEFRVEYVADRTHTFATAFLGLTFECARCHDHKYDPISQREYYQLFAFFNNIDECGVYAYHTKAIPTPTLVLSDDAKKEEVAQIERQIVEAEHQLQALTKTRQTEFMEWLAQPSERRLAAVRVLTESSSELELTGIPGRIAYLDMEGEQAGANQSVPGMVGQAVRLSGDDGIALEVGNFHRFEPFSVSFWLNTPNVKQRAVVFHRSGGWTDAGSRGYQMLIEEGKLSASLIHFWPGNAIRVRMQDPIPTNRWMHIAMTYDGSSRANGLRIFVDSKESECEVVRDHLQKNITGGGGDNIRIGERKRDRGFTHGMVDEFQVFQRDLTPIEVAHLYDDRSLKNVLYAEGVEITAEEREQLQPYFLANVDEVFNKQLVLLRELRQKRSMVVDDVAEIMVMRELPQRRPTYLLQRGAYDVPIDQVAPGTPAVLLPFPVDQPRNRLGLAAWLTHPDHPLTARVTVNRIWQILFGHGLVRTPEDFGSQGSAPVHPELLDWLAADFIEHQWDIKRLITTIVMSSTDRQESVINPDRLAEDPGNAWFARAPRYRLEAEMLRDNALAVSGLLVNQIGGTPAKPYELSVSFKPIEPDNNEGLYRRSLYTFWKRTAPAPVMMTLDAVKRDVCTAKRERTDSPLQALVLLNGPQFVEASRVLAQRLLRETEGEVDTALASTFRLLTSRHASEQEHLILRDLYNRQLARFSGNVDQAKQLLATGNAELDENVSVPQIAALTVVASMVMNLDECVMKR